MKNPNILIIGTGAIGGFYGGKLSQGGATVSTVCRSDFDYVSKNGITVKSVLGNFHYTPHKVVKTPTDYNEPLDYIVVATKVLSSIDVIPDIKKIISPNTAIVLLQNGIDIEKPFINAFPKNEVISGLAFICSSKPSDGTVVHEDFGRLVIGKFPKGESKNAKALGEIFVKSGIECEVTENAVDARWKKLIWNAPFNPLSVLFGGVNTQKMTNDDEMIELVRNIMKEVITLANASGENIPFELGELNIVATKNMTPYKPSMLLDYENKRPMEVEAILGNTLAIARNLDIAVPHIQTTYTLLKSIDRLNRTRNKK